MGVVVASLRHVCTSVAREVVCMPVQLPHSSPVPAVVGPDCPVICIHGYHSKYGLAPTDANGPQ